ncbi:uncharacterized protein MKK02DRAFT_29447 [Dioszegia hungarica]|uniref:Uncharacterized protein n=1 Tax=Dioszegia hungarica TaxID=4972 RepID=A0AA38HD78_9TREE|nr:uncharacterized protein MKK02DRAFT_29447 [Dioszegia hungarica]KAI9639368.1 hypothetical protein MKK02DRAFT_29447 [Dioszegia hungarica]
MTAKTTSSQGYQAPVSSDTGAEATDRNTSIACLNLRRECWNPLSTVVRLREGTRTRSKEMWERSDSYTAKLVYSPIDAQLDPMRCGKEVMGKATSLANTAKLYAEENAKTILFNQSRHSVNSDTESGLAVVFLSEHSSSVTTRTRRSGTGNGVDGVRASAKGDEEDYEVSPGFNDVQGKRLDILREEAIQIETSRLFYTPWGNLTAIVYRASRRRVPCRTKAVGINVKEQRWTMLESLSRIKKEEEGLRVVGRYVNVLMQQMHKGIGYSGGVGKLFPSLLSHISLDPAERQ